MTAIPDVIISHYPVNYDSRGYFRRLYEVDFSDKAPQFVQSSVSYNSSKGTLRGLHFQSTPSREWKFVKCIKGEIFDCLVDVRMDSQTYGQVMCLELNEKNNLGILIPPGIAHGFQTLENDTFVFYAMTDMYRPELGQTLSWSDTSLKIPWPLAPTSISVSDEKGLNWPVAY